MATYLVAHGAWSAGWAWKKMRPLMRARVFGRFYERARREGWGHDEIDASHNPHITASDALAVLLDRIAK